MTTARLTLLCAALTAGCGGGMATTPNPAIPASKVSSVVPSCASPLASGVPEPCTVVVTGTGSFNTAVIWSASSGAISSSGVLTAPTITVAASITVTATSVQDSVSGAAVVSVTPPAPTPPTITSVTVACPSPIQTGQISDCTANVQGQGSFNPAVTWSASDGTISTSGVWTAPQKVETVIVTATSVQNTKFSGTANVVVQAAPPPAVASVSVSCVSPVNSGATSQCSGTVSPAEAPQTLIWSASGGSIAQTGLWTAPTVTTNTNVIVTATSTADSTKSGMFTVAVTAAPPPPPSGPQNLGVGQSPVMRLDSNGAIDIAWITDSGIMFKRSTDGGATFSAPIMAVPLPVFADEMQMELDAANDIVILAVYAPFDKNGLPLPDTSSVSRSTDGQTFTTTPVATNGFFPQLAVEPAGAINVAWLAGTDSSLHEVRSTDGGVTFSKDRTIWTTLNDAVSIAAATGPQGQIYLFWSAENNTQCDILFTSSLDGAKTFSTPLNLSNNTGCSVGTFPVVDSIGNVNIAWSMGGSVFFTRSTDQGQTFSAPTNVFGTEMGVGSQKFVVDSNGQIDIVWGARTTDFDVLFAHSIDHGATFSSPMLLSLAPVPNFTGGGDPDVAVDAMGRISVAWEDDSSGMLSGDFDLYLETSTDGGATFGAAVNLSQTKGQSEVFPQIAVNQLGVRYLVWSQTSSSVEPNPTPSVFFDAVP